MYPIPRWCLVDIDLRILHSRTIYVPGHDFQRFNFLWLFIDLLVEQWNLRLHLLHVFHLESSLVFMASNCCWRPDLDYVVVSTTLSLFSRIVQTWHSLLDHHNWWLVVSRCLRCCCGWRFVLGPLPWSERYGVGSIVCRVYMIGVRILAPAPHRSCY